MPSTSLQDAHPKLRDAYLALKEEFKLVAPGRSLVVTCTYRSPEEQKELFTHGRAYRDGKWVVEDSGKIVTQLSGEPGRQSLHNLKPARALDVAVCVGGKVSWNEKEYLPLDALAEKHGLEWGGDWPNFKDYPHLQLPKEL